MSFGLFGVKVGMTQVFDSFGDRIPVTVLSVGPCSLLKKRLPCFDFEKGYYFAMMGYGVCSSFLSKSQKGFFDKIKTSPVRYIKEFKISESFDFSVGDSVGVDSFSFFNRLNVSAFSKGRGFQGVIKRYNFGRGPMSHGSRHHRSPGSIGACAYPAKVFKGKKMPGRMGGKVTVRNLDIFDIVVSDNVILVKGSVPGFNGQLLRVFGSSLKKDV